MTIPRTTTTNNKQYNGPAEKKTVRNTNKENTKQGAFRKVGYQLGILLWLFELFSLTGLNALVKCNRIQLKVQVQMLIPILIDQSKRKSNKPVRSKAMKSTHSHHSHIVGACLPMSESTTIWLLTMCGNPRLHTAAQS